MARYLNGSLEERRRPGVPPLRALCSYTIIYIYAPALPESESNGAKYHRKPLVEFAPMFAPPLRPFSLATFALD